MTFTINDVRSCAGGNHVEIDVTPSGRAMRTIRFLRSEILDEINPDSIEEARQRILLRCISRVKENTTGTPTPVQVRNSLVGQVFEV